MIGFEFGIIFGRLFLMGLKKYGKGDWRNISRNFVITRTPTQVASHAQKYFIRQLSGGKDKRRASIHDITTVNINDNQIPSPENRKPPASSSDNSSSQQQQQRNPTTVHKIPLQWRNQMMMNNNGAAAIMNFNMDHGNNVFMYSNGSQNPSYLGCQSMVFQMQSADQYPHA